MLHSILTTHLIRVDRQQILLGTKLPQKPSKDPIHATKRFVPTRAGRLNFGPWMAWWGYGAKDGFTPNFDTVKVKMAHLSIIPYSKSGFQFSSEL